MTQGWFPDIRLSGIRQSDFCTSIFAYHAFAYQDLCLSEADYEIKTLAHHGRTFAYHPKQTCLEIKNLHQNEEAKKRKLNVEELKSEADIFATK